MGIFFIVALAATFNLAVADEEIKVEREMNRKAATAAVEVIEAPSAEVTAVVTHEVMMAADEAAVAPAAEITPIVMRDAEDGAYLWLGTGESPHYDLDVIAATR